MPAEDPAQYTIENGIETDVDLTAGQVWAVARPQVEDPRTMRFELVRSGSTRDGRELDETLVLAAYLNTRKLMSEGFKPIMRPGHTANGLSTAFTGQAAESSFNDQQKIGTVEDIGIRRREDGELAIDGLIRLTAEGAKAWSAGHFDAVSWEAHTVSMTAKGRLLGVHIDKVAALGQERPAFHDLALEAGALQSEVIAMAANAQHVQAVINARQKAAAEDLIKMGISKEAAVEIASTHFEALKSDLERLPEDGEEEPVEEAAEEPAEEVEEESVQPAAIVQASIQKMESRVRELEFSNLVRDGRIAMDQKSDFLKIANAVGTDEAVQMFARMQTSTPPVDQIEYRDEPQTDDTEVAAAAKRLGMSAAETADLVRVN